MSGKRILIIDDDPELCEEIVEIFEDKGFDVFCTSNSDEGISLMDKGIYDIVLLDYKMTGITGVDMLKKIKNKNAATRIFIVSGRPFVDKIIEQEGLSNMVTDVIPKPINFETLFEKLKK